MAGTREDPFWDTVAKCDTCLDLNKDYLRRQWRRFGRLPALNSNYGFTVERLIRSAEHEDCHGCRALLEAVRDIQTNLGLDLENVRLEYMHGSGLEGLSLTLTSLYPVWATQTIWEKAQAAEADKSHFLTGPNVQTEVATGPTENTPDKTREYRILSPQYELFAPEIKDGRTVESDDWTAILTKTVLKGDSQSNEAVAWVQGQLEHCISKHVECNAHTSAGSPLPTRVLDLGVDLTLLNENPRLHVSSGVERANYVCLSHCWGPPDKKPLETTRETLDAFQRSIPWERLTATFREAIIFTRKLGIRYLWIDSLCIVQGDTEDWAREAGRMADVYENAQLTLAAASSKNSHEGLFRRGEESKLILSDDSSGVRKNISIRRLPDQAFFAYDRTSDFHHPDYVSPLLSRAWVFQERLLSRRMLYFTPLELVLECRSESISQSGQPHFVDKPLKHVFRAAYMEDVTLKQIDGQDGDIRSHPSLAYLWRSLVTDFTHLALTRASDTLPAMAGIAHRLIKHQARSQDSAREKQQVYLAGLWRPTMRTDLLWESVRPGPHGPVNTSVPSWSWARSNEPKQFIDGENLVYLCEVVDAWCDPLAGSSLLGVGPQGGEIVLEGFLIPARYRKPFLVVDNNPRVSYNVKQDYDWDKGEDFFLSSSGSDGPDRGCVDDGERLFVLPISLIQETSGASSYGESLAALVVRNCPGRADKYRRIGILRSSLLHLQHYEHILEGSDFLLRGLTRYLDFGKMLLGEDGLYHKPESGPKTETEESDSRDGEAEEPLTARDHRTMADHQYLCLAGTEGPDLNAFDSFYGIPHLKLMEDQVRAERDRVDEWIRRNENGQAQIRPRDVLRIV